MASEGGLSMASSTSMNRSRKEDEGVGTSSSSTAPPEHLVILVHGMLGRAKNWKFAEKRFKEKLANKLVVYCSTLNSATKTFKGIEKMGNRLAQEVMDVIGHRTGLTKISLMSHSLGGLISRHAIGQLYAAPGGRSLLQQRSGGGQNSAQPVTHDHPTVAGLEPVNFITLATPHLGCRGNGQMPILLGKRGLESFAKHLHFFAGNTGRDLYLADGNKGCPALLQRMVKDCVDGNFMSALQCFEQRTAYANICGDFEVMVGWRTASIRRPNEMPEAVHECLDHEYPHIVRVEEPPAVAGDSPPDGLGESTQSHSADAMEDSMILGLQEVSWRRVDVSFRNAKSKYKAHDLIQVKKERSHHEGADVIEHILDTHF